MASDKSLYMHVEIGSLFFGCMYIHVHMHLHGECNWAFKIILLSPQVCWSWEKENFQWFAWAADLVTVIILSLDGI